MKKKIIIVLMAVFSTFISSSLFALTLKTGYGTYKTQPDNKILLYPSDNSQPVVVYSGSQRVLAMTYYKGNVITAFSGKGIYKSPNGRHLGGGGSTSKVYSGNQYVKFMKVCRGGIYTQFSKNWVYFSPHGSKLGGGGSTIRAYTGKQAVKRMICERGTGNNGADSVITTFSGGGVYKSTNGWNIGGGGNTIRLN